MSSKIDWRDVLNPSQFAVYDLLRKKRKEIGERTKIPLYGILSNEQLALMAQNPPKTKEEFIKIKGVSEQKYKQFGEEFLETVKSAMLSAEQAENVVVADSWNNNANNCEVGNKNWNNANNTNNNLGFRLETSQASFSRTIIFRRWIILCWKS